MTEFTLLYADGPQYTNGGRAFPLTADAILLADFAMGTGARCVLDIGCGSGIVGLLIAWNNRDAVVTGIDISETAVACTRDNIAQNSLGDRFFAMQSDIMSDVLPEKSFDLIVCNPPYYEKGRGKPAGESREESSATLSDIIVKSSKLLCAGGAVCMVIRPERLENALDVMAKSGLSPTRQRLVVHKEGYKPSMVLIEAKLLSSAKLEILPHLILKDGENRDSDDIKRIYRMN